MNDDLATGSFSKFAIIGPGLLGGSIALALRQRALKTKIAIWARRELAIDEARKMQLADGRQNRPLWKIFGVLGVSRM